MTGELIDRAGASARLFRDAPKWGDHKTAALGAFRCETEQAGTALLTTICSELRAEGVEAIIGPMDGDTWHAYRTITGTDGSVPFLMEPTAGDHDYAAFRSAGFEPISSYVSTRGRLEDAISQPPDMPEDCIISAWDGTDPAHLFGHVFDLSLQTFQRNAFYKPITRSQFLALYEPYVPMLDKRFILFARRGDGTLLGFLFGIPDFLQGPETKTVILKSYASGHPGVGHCLAHRFHQTALENGFDTVIHALMHEDNKSLDRSAKHGASVFRRYALMGRVLRP